MWNYFLMMNLKKQLVYKFNNCNLKSFQHKNSTYFFVFNKNRSIICKFKNFIFKSYNSELFLYAQQTNTCIFTFLQNILKGVMCNYKKNLEIRGIGYKFEINDNFLVIDAGLSHTIHFKKPNSINFFLKKNKLKIFGFDFHQVSQIASRIKLFKKIDPYKGKGVRYLGECITLKQGKKKKR